MADNPLKGITADYPLTGISEPQGADYAGNRITGVYAKSGITVPSIEDAGRDGYPFCHIDFVSDAGAWRDILPFCLNIRILPDMDAQRPLDPVEGCGDTIAPASLPGLITPFHDPLISSEAKDDHA